MSNSNSKAVALTENMISSVKAIQHWRESSIDIILVSKASSIYDDNWNFYEDRKEWPASIGRSKLRVQWDQYDAIPENMRQELQRIFAIRYKSPSTFSTRPLKENSLCALIQSTLRFLNFVLNSEVASRGGIESIADISWHILSSAAKSYSGNNADIKKGLKVVYASASQPLISTDVSIYQADLKNLEFHHVVKKRTEDDSEKCIPDNVFRLLTTQSASMIAGFLDSVGIPRKDRSVDPAEARIGVPNIYLYDLDSYVRYRQDMAEYRDGVILSQPTFSLDRAVRTPTKPLLDYIKHLNIAAIATIALFTGMRYSELAALRSGLTLTDIDGARLLRGKVFKGKKAKRLSGEWWVAIPIVEDAIAVLEKLSELKNNEFLASSTDTNGKAKKNVGPFQMQTMCAALEKFVGDLDIDGSHSGHRFNTHQFRHTLTRHLVRSGLGLAYISFQLKHAHKAYQSVPSDVTLGYGGVATELQSEAADNILRYKKEAGQSLYDPNAPVMGIGGEKFAERRKAYFEGMMADGYTEEEIIEYLLEVQSPFVNVGLGYCGGKTPDELGNKPPCVGSLKCNPAQCSNAVVTSDNLPMWKKVKEDNERMAEDPRFFYAKDQFAAAAAEAVQVINIVESGVPQ
jgi:hypothetical protein